VLLESVLYPRGNALAFADLNEVLAGIATDSEKRRLAKMLSRQPTLLVKLHIKGGEDVEPLVKSWGREGRAMDVQPLLDSLARLPNGGALDVAHLLTSLRGWDYYPYPFPSEDPVVNRRDCAWTAMNFFNEEPEDRFYDFEVARRTIAKEYYPI